MGGFGGVPPGGGGPPAGGGGGGNPLPEFQVFKDYNSAVADSNAATVLMGEALKVLGAQAETADKKILKFKDNLRGSILIADNTTEALKMMSEQTKALAKDFTQNKGLQSAKVAYQGLIQNLREMAARNRDNSKMVTAFNRQINALTAAEERLNKVTEEQFSQAEGWVEVTKNIGAAAKEVTRLGAAVSNLKMGGLGTYVGDTRKALIDAGIMKAGRFEKWTAMGEAGIKLKEAAKAKRDANKGDFLGRRDLARTAVEDLEKKGHIKLVRAADGGVDWARMASDRKKLAKAGGAAGAGDLGTTMGLLQQAGAAPKGGLMGKLAGGGGLIESAVGAGAEMAGKFALPLAIAEAVKDLIVSLIDKNAEMNKQAETLSGGGLLAGAGLPGGASAADTFLAARSNLMPSYGVSALGLNYDRNIKMAQAVIESGYGIEEIGQGGVFGAKKEGDFAPGTFGEIQKMAATTGRVSGMGDAASIQMSMKLLTQYKESMAGTEDFMINLNKDFRMAGLSVAKYVSILEEVTGQFDRMNKSIDQTSGVLRALSRTGRQTAEDLAEEMKNIVGDPKRDTGMRIYLDQQMQKSGQAQDNAAQQESVRQKEVQNAYNALGGDKGIGLQYNGHPITHSDVNDLLKTQEGRDQLNTMMTSLQAANPNIDARRMISAQGAVTKAGQESDRATLMKQFASGNIDANTYDARIEALGKSPTTQANENLAAAKTVMRMAGLDENALYQGGALKTNRKTQSLLEFFKLSPTLLRDTQTELQNQGQSRLRLGMTNETYGKGLFDLYKSQMGPEGVIKKVTDATTGKERDETFGEALNRWTKDPRYGKQFINLLRGGNKEMELLYNSQSDLTDIEDEDAKKAEKARIEEAARSAGRVTQTTADIFANAFSYYFTEVVNVLEKIRLYFAHSKWFGGVTEDMEIAGAASVKKDMAKLDQAAADNDLRIADINRQLQSGDLDPTKKDDLEKQLRDEQAKKAALETRTKFGAGSGLSGYDAANLADIAAGEIKGGQQPLADALKAMNAQMDKAGDYTLTPDQYAQQKKMLEATGAMGLVSQNKDAQGATTSYTVHITQYSSDTNMQTGTLNDTRKSVEANLPKADQGGSERMSQK
jgi:hypothetical protein